MTTVFDPNTLIEQIETIDPNKDYHSELVGEGKKFADDAALARAKAESDLFIKRLQDENKKVRDELARQAAELKTRTSLDEFLQKVKDGQTAPTGGSNPDTKPDQTILNEEKITEIIESRLTAKERTARESANVREVQEGLTKALGGNYVDVLNQKVEELGLDKDTLDALAKRSPKAFFAVLGVTVPAQKTIFNAPNGSVNTPPGHSTGTRNYKYYNELKKKLPADQYYSPAIQNEMFENARKLGDDFYS